MIFFITMNSDKLSLLLLFSNILLINYFLYYLLEILIFIKKNRY